MPPIIPIPALGARVCGTALIDTLPFVSHRVTPPASLQVGRAAADGADNPPQQPPKKANSPS